MKLFHKIKKILKAVAVVVAIAAVGVAPAVAQTVGNSTAVFPNGLVTSGQTLVASNRGVTTVTAPVGISDTTINVASTTLFPGSLSASNATGIVIDNEFIKVCGSTSTTFTVCTGGRNFDGSTATTHNANANVFGYVLAAHTNQLAAEVQAIETAVAKTSAYNFAAISPGGSLTAGITNTITFPNGPPPGMAATDTAHPVYVSGGTGTAEAQNITGGTCTLGQTTSCTLTLTPTFSHSGAFTLTSATAGCQENYFGNGGTGNLGITFPAGAFNFYAPCKIAVSGVVITGAGATSGTNVTQNTANVDAFQFIAPSNGQGNGLYGLQITGQASSTSGYAVDTVNQTYFTSERVYAVNWANGILNNNGVTWTLRDWFVRNLNTGDGYVGLGSSENATLIDNFQVASAAGSCEAAIRLTVASNTIIKNAQIGGCTNAMLLNPGNGQVVASTDMENVYFDHANGVGLAITPASGGSVVRTRCSQCWFASSASAAGINLSGAGTVAGLLIVNGELSGNGGSGLTAANTLASDDNVQIIGSTVANNTGAGIVIPSNATNWKIEGNTIGNNVSGWGASSSQTNGVFSNATTGYQIVGNTFAGNATAPFNIPSAGSNLVIANNRGVDDVIPTPVASATTITAPANPFFAVTGTTTITTINGSWVGRRIRIYKTDGTGNITIGGGGNIPLAHTLSQNGSLDLTFDSALGWF